MIKKNCVDYLNVSSNLCYGCGSCLNICPRKAISMIHDEHGFLIPRINSIKCNNCGLCTLSCPVYSYNQKLFINCDTNPPRFVFAGNDDVLTKSSSGGIFSYIATLFLNQGGFVVGASWSHLFKVKHEIINDIKDLNLLRVSKYVQSDQANCYKRVKKLLNNNKLVLYTGTPCQIAGLLSFLKHKDYANLLTIDLLCHGIPSHKLLCDYLDSNYGIDNIYQIRMRKLDGWNTCLDVFLNNGKVCNGKLFIKAFLNDIILRDCCYSCKFACIPRVSDITIGDNWHAHILKLDKQFQKKSSIVLVNNQKGGEYLKKALNSSIGYTIRDISSIDIGLLNENIVRPNSRYSNYVKTFWEYYKTMDFTSAYMKTVLGLGENDKLVGLVLYASNNYGSCATNYALYLQIKKFGYSPIVLNSLVPMYGISNNYLSKNCITIKDLIDKNDIESLNNVFPTFVVGSDYSFNISVSITRDNLEYLLLGFVKNHNKKIAYAPSLGLPDFEHKESLRILFKCMLKRFNHLSFRENSAREHCKKFLGIDSENVLDPVFLLDRDDYYNISKQSNLKITDKYILVYMLDPTPTKIKLVDRYEKLFGLKKYVILDLNTYDKHFNDFDNGVLNRLNFEDFVYYFYNSEFIITDSFHGTCFSLIFNKKFVSIKNRNVKRFDELISILKQGLDFLPIYNSSEQAYDEKIKSIDFDYEIINSLLEKYSQNSKNYLLNSLSSDNQLNNEIDSIEMNLNYIKLWRNEYNNYQISKNSILSIPYEYVWKEFARIIQSALPSYLELSNKYSNYYYQIFFKQISYKIHYEMLVSNSKLFFCVHCEDSALQKLCFIFFEKVSKVFSLDKISFIVNIPIIDANFMQIDNICLNVLLFIGKLDQVVTQSLLPVFQNK